MGSQTQVHYLLLHGCAPHLWYLLIHPYGTYGRSRFYDAYHGSRRCLARGFPARNVGPGNGQTRRKLRDLPGVDYTKSFTDGSKSVIYINLKEDLPSDKIRPAWEEARNMINDEWKSLPQGVQGPTINDRFDDVYGIIYAISGDEYSYEEKRQQAEDLKRQLLSVPNV